MNYLRFVETHLFVSLYFYFFYTFNFITVGYFTSLTSLTSAKNYQNIAYKATFFVNKSNEKLNFSFFSVYNKTLIGVTGLGDGHTT